MEAGQAAGVAQPPPPGRQGQFWAPDPRLLRRRGSGSFPVPGSGLDAAEVSGWKLAAPRQGTFHAAPSGRRILAADGYASTSNDLASCFYAVWAPVSRGVAVAMSGPTGFGML